MGEVIDKNLLDISKLTLPDDQPKRIPEKYQNDEQEAGDKIPSLKPEMDIRSSIGEVNSKIVDVFGADGKMVQFQMITAVSMGADVFHVNHFPGRGVTDGIFIVDLDGVSFKLFIELLFEDFRVDNIVDIHQIDMVTCFFDGVYVVEFGGLTGGGQDLPGHFPQGRGGTLFKLLLGDFPGILQKGKLDQEDPRHGKDGQDNEIFQCIPVHVMQTYGRSRLAVAPESFV